MDEIGNSRRLCYNARRQDSAVLHLFCTIRQLCSSFFPAMLPRFHCRQATIHPTLAIAKMRVKKSDHCTGSTGTHIFFTILSISFIGVGLGSLFKHRIVIDALKFLPSCLGNLKLSTEHWHLTYPSKEDVRLPSLSVIARPGNHNPTS